MWVVDLVRDNFIAGAKRMSYVPVILPKTKSPIFIHNVGV